NRKLQEMIAVCDQVHPLAKKLNKKEILGQSYKWKGYAFYSLNEIGKAFSSYETAELVFEEAGIIKELISTKLSLGVLYRNVGELKKSLEILKESLTLCEACNITNSTIYNNIGLVYAAQEKYEMALGFYEKAILNEELQENPNTIQITRFRVNSAGMHIFLGNYEIAENLFLESIELCKTNKDYEFLIVSYKGLANLYLQQKNYEEAEVLLVNVKKLSEDLNSYAELINITLYLASLNKFLKRKDKQHALLLESLKIAKKSYQAKELEVLQLLLEFYEGEEDWQEAFAILKQLNEQQIAKYNKEREEKFLEFQQKFESEQKDILLKQEKAFNATLRSKNRELAEANEDLEQFNHGVSHDLKEPLRLIKGRLTLLKMRAQEKLSEEENLALDSGLAAAARMEKMLEDLYKFSSLGKNLRQEAEVDLNEVLQIVQADLQMRIKEYNAEIRLADLPKVRGFKSMYVQLFQNLVNNALKFKREGVNPLIEILYEEEAKWHLIKVKDNGLGIKEENLEKIFKLFKRLDETKHIEGSGVGLSIVQKIAKKMQGEISLASDINLGTVFSIKLPKK
ncbi:MAG: tetratricopeptide repeat protein, partial [Bacteroidetes bacterium]|nr:tetratricopeptide repeat protein [Bacteroidota bacterium]